MSQLRYYWEHAPDDYNRYGDNPYNLISRIINAQQMYGYEYLGNSTRLVITPLTGTMQAVMCTCMYVHVHMHVCACVYACDVLYIQSCGASTAQQAGTVVFYVITILCMHVG